MMPRDEGLIHYETDEVAKRELDEALAAVLQRIEWVETHAMIKLRNQPWPQQGGHAER